MTTHLERLLFAQGGTCFFCRKPLPRAEASVEHLVASANGGTNGDDNCVACCKTLNHLLGSKSIKEKLQVVLNQRGDFRCPGNVSATQPPVQAPDCGGAMPPAGRAGDGNGNGAAALLPASDRIKLVVSDLRKRGASRPRKISTLTSTIKALIKQQQQLTLSDADAAALVQELQRRGQLTVTDTKVSYTLG